MFPTPKFSFSDIEKQVSSMFASVFTSLLFFLIYLFRLQFYSQVLESKSILNFIPLYFFMLLGKSS